MSADNLYHVQDSDRPMWVLAPSYPEALAKWKEKISKEMDCKVTDVDDPQGISLVCEANEIIK